MRHTAYIVLTIAALIAIGFFGVTAIWAIIAGAVAGIVYNSIRAGRYENGCAGNAV